MTTQHIRTRADGSIDTDFYIRRGRHMRSLAAHEIIIKPTLPAAPRPRHCWLATLFRRPALS